MSDTLLVFNSTAECRFATNVVATGLGELEGKVVGFIDNAKPNFDVLVDYLSDILTTRYGVREVVKRGKRHPALGAGAPMLDELAASYDLVITGSGD